MDSSERKPWTPPDLHLHAPEGPRAFMLNFSSVEEGHIYEAETLYDHPIAETPQLQWLIIGAGDARVERLPGSDVKGLVPTYGNSLARQGCIMTFDTWYQTLSATISLSTAQSSQLMRFSAWEVDVEEHDAFLTLTPGQHVIHFERLFPQLARIRQIQFHVSTWIYKIGIDTIFGFE